MTRRTESAWRRRLVFAACALSFAIVSGVAMGVGAYLWAVLLLLLTTCFTIAASIEVKQ